MAETVPGAAGPVRAWAQETDLLSALFRTAFLLAFVPAPLYLRHADAVHAAAAHWAVRLIIVVAALFTITVYLTYARRRSLRWQRPLSLAVDTALISAALYTFGPTSAMGLFQVYYLIVLQGAVWFRVAGSLTAAVAAAIGYAVVQIAFTGGSFLTQTALATHSIGLPFLFIVAVVSGYLVASRDREHQEASRLRNEMLLARTLQDIMLPPQPPRIRGWAVGLRLEPALEVGGDLYILERLASGDWVVCLGDISGKSVYGLIYLSMVVAHTRAAAHEGLPPAQIARQVNAQVYEMLAPETYAALFIGLLNPETGVLTFVNCGHPPPLVVAPEQGEVRVLPTGGLVIGAVRDVVYRQETLTLAPGEALVGYTDGLSEPRSRQGEEFGEERIGRLALAALQEGRDAEELVGRLLLAARRWTATPGKDDATCLVLQRLGEETVEP